ncbi:MAG TPA: anthranilate phosphoribosyltransferase [Polyangia bacterium]|jgi:anthranilate phosphoribosyltransferase|nr:anthranilate phosphoribosyltransferase [Polyangia bacterium]
MANGPLGAEITGMGVSPDFGVREALARIVDKGDLSADEMARVVGKIMDGEVTAPIIAALLIALRMKGETVGEVVGAARAMRQRMTRVPFDAPVIVDTCGTGGDNSQSVNVSTLASFIVAGCGVVVAKHGNRAQSSRSGSHDVLEALGLDAAPTPDVAARCLREAKLAFLFAPAHHSATKHASGPRKELGVRTIFNLLGPLTNPAGAQHHVNGVFGRDRCELVARAHGVLGSKRALVIHGAPGLDEFAPTGMTHVAELKDGAVRSYEVTPADFGLPPEDPIGLLGGSPEFNALVMSEVLYGVPQHDAVRSVAIMTAAAALYVAGEASDLRAGAQRAASALSSGAARAVLETLRGLTPKS